MKVPASIGVPLGLLFIGGPWLWAWLELRANPSLGGEEGPWTMATYIAVFTMPLGLYFVVSSLKSEGAR